MNEKEKTNSKNKQIGLGIIFFAVILFVLLTFIIGLIKLGIFGPLYPFGLFLLFGLIMFTSTLVCVGFVFLFLGCSHDEIGNYLIFMGLTLILFGTVLIILFNIPSIIFILYFFQFGFPLGYLSGPVCIIFGICEKKKKDQYQTGTLAISGLIIFSVSLIALTLFLIIMTFTTH